MRVTHFDHGRLDACDLGDGSLLRLLPGLRLLRLQHCAPRSGARRQATARRDEHYFKGLKKGNYKEKHEDAAGGLCLCAPLACGFATPWPAAPATETPGGSASAPLSATGVRPCAARRPLRGLRRAPLAATATAALKARLRAEEHEARAANALYERFFAFLHNYFYYLDKL